MAENGNQTVPESSLSETNPLANLPQPPDFSLVKPKKSKMARFVLMVISLVVIVILLAIGVYYSLSRQKQTASEGRDETKSGDQLSTKNWVNCSDVRDIVLETDRIYLACLGGVLVLDNAGHTVDQITMGDGLGNSTTTSLEKQGNKLYVGTQDGFTEFNLATREAKKVSVPEGLVNGSNIELALDGDTLWVATFDGLASYDTQTGQITNFKQDFVSLGTKYSARALHVAPNGIYAIVTANAYSSGGIVRFDKASASWGVDGVGELGIDGQFPRLDLISIFSVGSLVFTTDGRSVWEANDASGAQWLRSEGFENEIKRLYGDSFHTIRLLNSDTENLIVSVNTNDRTYVLSYNVQTKQLKPFISGLGEVNMASVGTLPLIQHGTKRLWFKDVNDAKGLQDGWLMWVDIQSKKVGTYSLVDRPESFAYLLAAIDDKVVINSGSNEFWLYTPSSETFDKMFELEAIVGSEGSGLVFQPIIGKSQVFVFNQACGMGCSEPEFGLFDYATKVFVSLELDQAILDQLTENQVLNTPMYSLISYLGYAEDEGKISFEMNIWGSAKRLGLDYAVATSTFSTHELADQQVATIYGCNNSYSFTALAFQRSSECLLVPQNATYSWVIKDNALVQKALTSGEEEALEIAAAPTPYSPFPNWTENRVFRKMVYVDDKLWLASNLGLSLYDTASREAITFDVGDLGIINNDIENIVVTNAYIWLITHWGGLSRVPYNSLQL